ncbi:MAG: DUF6722 family protein [Bacteroidales bacterium]
MKAEHKRELGRHFLDISKLILGGIVIGTIIKQEINVPLTLIFGAIVYICFLICGLILTNYKEKK